MKVKIGNEIYDSKEVPVMLVLDNFEKTCISGMEENCYKFACTPSSMSGIEIELFMETDDDSLEKHTL